MLPVIKVWEMDYSFIIKNYLDVKLWSKTWTLFEYKDFVITIRLSSINTSDKEIIFFILLKDNANENSYKNRKGTLVEYKLDTDIDFLIRRINGAIFRLIEEYERNIIIPNLPSYSMVNIYEEQEKHKLMQIANEYLDKNNVTNETIRGVYVENYVDNNSEAYGYEIKFKDVNEYHHLTDLYLVFTKSAKDDTRYQMVLDSLHGDEREKVTNEINELQVYIETDEYEDEKKSELESI